MTTARLKTSQSPNGFRNSHMYSSPHHKPNASYNFWHDIKANLLTRTQWEDQNSTLTQVANSVNNGGFLASFQQNHNNIPNKRNEARTQNVSRTEVQQVVKVVDQKKYMARFMYSQVELGSDTDSERGSITRRPQFLSQERLITNNNIRYEDNYGANKTKTQANTQRNSLSRDNSMCSDGNLKRKVDANLKWFTS